MKNLGTKVLLITTTLSLFSPWALADQLAFSCEGNLEDASYSLDVYQGSYGYEASLILTVTQGEKGIVTKAPAKGGYYSECGSRSVPCKIIQNAQYTSEHPNLIFTMTSPADAKTGQGDLAFYDNGFGSDQSADVRLTCQKLAQ